MLVVACSGFPIAVSRYLQEFMAVEVADTELGIPGTGTVRRWKREAPEGFVFTVLAPHEIGGSGFADGPETEHALQNILAFCKKLDALALVIRVPDEVPHTRAVGARAKRLLGSLPADAPFIVLDAPHWDATQVRKIAEATGAVAACDPLTLRKAPSGELAYLALPGPASYRSRYDDDAIQRIAELCKHSEAATTFCVFRNIDMEANAKALIDAVKKSAL